MGMDIQTYIHTFILIHHGTHPLELGGHCRSPTCQRSSRYQNTCIHTLQRHLHHRCLAAVKFHTVAHPTLFQLFGVLKYPEPLTIPDLFDINSSFTTLLGRDKNAPYRESEAGSTSNKLTRYRFIRTI